MSRTFPNPLLATHEAVGAEFQGYDTIQIVSTFGEPQAEYAALRKGAAILDEPQRGFLELTGKDRLPFLNNLLTNQTWDKSSKSGLSAGQGVYAFYLNTKGRIVADLNVLELGDRTLLELDARRAADVKSAFEKYLFAEQVKIADRVDSLHAMSIHGPGARQVLADAAGGDFPELKPLGSIAATLVGVEAVVWRDDATGVPGYHLIVETNDAERLWSGLLDRLGKPAELGRRPLRPAGWAAYNAARVEAGRPIFGIDFDDSVLPHETGQIDRAVSFTKGCYLGQEIVARMHARGQWARQLVGIRMADDALPIAGTLVYDASDNAVGGITSSTVSPVLSNAAIALGYVKKNFTPVGTVVQVPAEGKMRKGSVVETPFAKFE